MQEHGLRSKNKGLDIYGIHEADQVYWNLTPPELVEIALARKEGVLTDTGALMCDTGKFTGRAPKDRYIVDDEKTHEHVWWGDINQPVSPEVFKDIKEKLIANLEKKDLYVRDAYAGADKHYRLKLRVITTVAWQSLFCYNMFLRPNRYKLEKFEPNFTLICDPNFEVDPEKYGIRSRNFSIINFTERMIIIGGTAYAGEIKKGIFGVLNFLLPTERNVLPMHCSANIGHEDHDTAIFFGLSGTGKTALSCHSHWLKFPEKVGIKQDDVVIFTSKGKAIGTEESFYVKTESMEPKIQPLL